jgi:predicted phage terminase large subunit-like protein
MPSVINKENNSLYNTSFKFRTTKKDLSPSQMNKQVQMLFEDKLLKTARHLVNSSCFINDNSINKNYFSSSFSNLDNNRLLSKECSPNKEHKKVKRNINILNKLWNSYSVDARQRMMDGCKEIIIATRWSVHDPIGRLERLYANSDSTKRTRFIAVPDIDPVTNESNFMFSVNGLSKEFFESQALVMDEISYRCLYKQDPIEREGLLYHEDELRRFTDLPLREPDSVVGICDTKNTGTDFMVMPIFYVYDEDYYLVDVVCDNGTDFNVLYTRMVDMIIEHMVQAIEFESNQGGRAITTQIRNMLNERHWVCNITEKPTETNKEARIIANSYQVKKMILFKDKNLIQAKSDYSVMMDQLLSYTQLGKNKHDDVPDCLANFILYATRKTTHKAAVIRKNFW